MALWERYRERLAPEQGRLELELQEIPAQAHHPAHLFAVLLPSWVDRTALLRRMLADNIRVAWHYEPLHQSPLQARVRGGAPAPSLPVTEERVAPRLLRLPLHGAMTLQDADFIVDCLVRGIEAAAGGRRA
jgi:dTDP-4-amino-4,6-dideoxygalactose transaminase